MDNNVEVKKLRSLSDGRGRWARESERERERGGGRGDVGGVVQAVVVGIDVFTIVCQRGRCIQFGRRIF